jgi:membrane protein
VGDQVPGGQQTSAQQPSEGIIASLFVAFGLLLSGATGVFAELQTLLSGCSAGAAVRHKQSGGTARRCAFAALPILAFLLMISLYRPFWRWLHRWAGSYLPL